MNTKELVEFYELLISSLEGTISDRGYCSLMSRIQDDAEAASCYVEFLAIYTNLSCPVVMGSGFEENASSQTFQVDDDLCSFDADVWQALLEVEQTAPSVIIEKPVEKPLVQHVQYQLSPRKINKFSLCTAILASAALFVIIIFLQFFPVPTSQEVATLTDLVDVKWGTAPHSMEKGSRLKTNTGPIRLNGGVIGLSCDSGVEVTIEGPAEFEILTSSEIRLDEGRLYSVVSGYGLGFTVKTSNARIIDLGTEFGVQVFDDGATELHVFKGKTALVAGVSSVRKQAIDVNGGQARSVSSDNSHVTNIPLKNGYFAEKISPVGNLIWRGQNMSLASLVAGGDGFSEGQVGSGIDPATGEIHAEVIQAESRKGDHRYHRVDSYQGVDGVFIPNGQASANVVSSAGHVFKFPVAADDYWSDITAYPYVVEQLRDDSGDINAEGSIRININDPRFEATPNAGLIFLHSNAGITFDLNEIRKHLPNLEITGFKSLCGVEKTRQGMQASEFWVLLDGKRVFHTQNDAENKDTKEINIPITPNQRFLTLAVTDGWDTNSYDWCVFAKPELELEPISQ